MTRQSHLSSALWSSGRCVVKGLCPVLAGQSAATTIARFSFGVLRFWPPEGTPAVDGVLHLMGDRVCRLGGSTKHRTEAGGWGIEHAQ